jgi:hypothetical protein
MKMRQKGSAAIIALVSIVVLIVGVIGICAMGYIGAVNYGAEVEPQLKTAKENSENFLAQYGQTLGESVQVPGMATDDVVKIMTASIGGRYGPNGSQAAVQVIREQNGVVDQKLYERIQQLIESGRAEYKQSQTKMLDIKRGYETNLGYAWRGFWLRTAGFPKVNLADFKVISTDRAQEAFKNGKESAPISLRPGLTKQ